VELYYSRANNIQPAKLFNRVILILRVFLLSLYTSASFRIRQNLSFEKLHFVSGNLPSQIRWRQKSEEIIGILTYANVHGYNNHGMENLADISELELSQFSIRLFSFQREKKYNSN